MCPLCFCFSPEFLAQPQPLTFNWALPFKQQLFNFSLNSDSSFLIAAQQQMVWEFICQCVREHECVCVCLAQNGVLIKCLSIKSLKNSFCWRASSSEILTYTLFHTPVISQISFVFSTCEANLQDDALHHIGSKQPVDVLSSSLANLLSLFIFVNLFLCLSFIFDSPLYSLSLCLGEKQWHAKERRVAWGEKEAKSKNKNG